jgi:DNA repair protein RecO (recombination protein O)
VAVLRDRALLLRRHPYGESSLVAHLLTRDHGRVQLVAKGAHRPTSRFAWTLDLFVTLEVEWSARPGRELGILRAADVTQRRKGITEDLARYRAALAELELAELAARPELADRGLASLLETGLDVLDEGQAPPPLALVAIDLAFLQTLGLRPALRECAACGRAAPGDGGPRIAPFAAGAGGRLCEPCAAEARASGRRVVALPTETLEIAAEVADAGPRPPRLRLPEEKFAGVRSFVERFLAYHLETLPRTRRGARAPLNAAAR